VARPFGDREPQFLELASLKTPMLFGFTINPICREAIEARS
jgi:hypothetical protein